MATHTSILGWRIPWTEEPGGLQSMWADTTEQLSSSTAKERGNREGVQVADVDTLPKTGQQREGKSKWEMGKKNFQQENQWYTERGKKKEQKHRS